MAVSDESVRRRCSLRAVRYVREVVAHRPVMTHLVGLLVCVLVDRHSKERRKRWGVQDGLLAMRRGIDGRRVVGVVAKVREDGCRRPETRPPMDSGTTEVDSWPYRLTDFLADRLPIDVSVGP
jgi:hypothetical protein